MTEREAVDQLADSDLVPYAQASLDHCKEMLETCLTAEIPAMIMKPDDSERMQLLVRQEDLEQVSGIFDQQWREMAEKEGTFIPGDATPLEESEDGELPCPACGTAEPLVDGACTDCGIVLE